MTGFSRRVLLTALATVLVVGGVIVALLVVFGYFGDEASESNRATVVEVDDPTASTPATSTTSVRPTADEPPGSPSPVSEPSAHPSPVTLTPPANDVPEGSPTGQPTTGPYRAPAGVDLSARADEVAERYGIDVSVAWFDPQHGVRHSGALTDSPAWSTAKVPLALAVIHNGDGEMFRAEIEATLRRSDNETADVLWRSLGSDDAARAEALTEVLRQAGDNRTAVPSSRLHPPYSIFGQTLWATGDQVRFLLQLSEMSGSDQVVSEMSAVTAGQRWGLAALDGAVFKGGWGPTTSGGYTVRQFGWYRGTGGDLVPVAVAVRAGSFDEGIAAVNELVAGLR